MSASIRVLKRPEKRAHEAARPPSEASATEHRQPPARTGIHGEPLETAGLPRPEMPAGLEEFAKWLVHELNNPLTALLGFAELLQEDVLSEQGRIRLKHVANQAGRIRCIVTELQLRARELRVQRRAAGDRR